MTNNVKSEIKNTGFADIPCDETIHRDDNHIFHICKWNIKDQFIGYSGVIFPHKEKPNYYYFVARGSGKSIRELCYVAKVMSNHSSHMLSTTYSSEYKTQNYKSDMKNLYKDKIFHKASDYYLTNIHHNQRSNNQEEMSCFKLIDDRNNDTNKKFHK